MDQPIIRLRPHHVLCLRNLQGEGYTPAFAEHMHQLLDRLQSQQRVMVQIIMHRDSLCMACPRLHNALCDEEQNALAFDRAVAQACDLRSGQWLPWQELCEKIDAARLRPEHAPGLCGECVWFPLCEKQAAAYSVKSI